MPPKKKSSQWKIWTVFGVVVALCAGVFAYRLIHKPQELDGLEGWLRAKDYTMFKPFREDWMPGSIIRVSGGSLVSALMASDLNEDLSSKYRHSSKVDYQYSLAIVSDGSGRVKLSEVGGSTGTSGKTIGKIQFTLKGTEAISLSLATLCQVYANDSQARQFMERWTAKTTVDDVPELTSNSPGATFGWGQGSAFLDLLGFGKPTEHVIVVDVIRADSVECEFKQNDDGAFDAGVDIGSILGEIAATFQKQSEGVYLSQTPICLGFRPVRLVDLEPYYVKTARAVDNHEPLANPIPQDQLPQPLTPQHFAKLQETVLQAEQNFVAACASIDKNPFEGQILNDHFPMPGEENMEASVGGVY